MTAYFNTLEFKKALSLIGKKPVEAKIRYEEYIKKYPKDYSAYINYAVVLIKLGDLLSAEKILDYVEEIYTNDNNFLKEKEKIKYMEYNLALNRLKILLYEERYEEFYKLYLENKNMFDPQEIQVPAFYAKKKLGILKYDDYESYNYIYRQIINYSEKEFKKHVKNHLIDKTENTEEGKSMFVSKFPINKVLEEIKKYIPSDKRIYNGFYQDTYIFKYDYCGKDDNKAADYFKVICFHNTSDFITMCPSTNCQYLPCIDLNYMAKEKPKQKQLSQIEKFNKRYRNKRSL